MVEGWDSLGNVERGREFRTWKRFREKKMEAVISASSFPSSPDNIPSRYEVPPPAIPFSPPSDTPVCSASHPPHWAICSHLSGRHRSGTGLGSHRAGVAAAGRGE